ncbi:hypothetical protein SAMN03159338_1588 [Sphingomonas sp. NFR04]|jgi:phosphatidylglycerophosphate synthase|uniref:hypothetical protein n=1 Tax=Sphingomonas sp. NFR04 TaxID=1566283 RepID=UPI0008ECEFD3|nr:hypothetical protein [Sphingomonas sp. NFR04]SFJ50290.1 hypothetical protein SAMN03159338_1588 [Sphingomonas sp. NFR04]
MIVGFTLVMSILAIISGIVAVGSGKHWRFKVPDYFRGKRNAVLYAWVTASTCLSLYLTGVLVEFGIRNDWSIATPYGQRFFFIHAVAGILFTLAHIFVAVTLSKEVGPVDKYLWGEGNRSAD